MGLSTQPRTWKEGGAFLQERQREGEGHRQGRAQTTHTRGTLFVSLPHGGRWVLHILPLVVHASPTHTIPSSLGNGPCVFWRGGGGECVRKASFRPLEAWLLTCRPYRLPAFPSQAEALASLLVVICPSPMWPWDRGCKKGRGQKAIHAKTPRGGPQGRNN